MSPKLTNRQTSCESATLIRRRNGICRIATSGKLTFRIRCEQDNTIVYSMKIIVSTLVQGMKIQNIIYTYKCVYMTRLQNNLIFYTIVLQTNLKDLFVNLIH
jgi:hypothetical protein